VLKNALYKSTLPLPLFTSGSFDVTPKTIEENLVKRIGKFEAETTKRLRSMHCTVEATKTHEPSRGLSATAKLRVHGDMAISRFSATLNFRGPNSNNGFFEKPM